MRWGHKRFLTNPGCESYALLRAVDLRLGRGSSVRPPSEEFHFWDHGIDATVDSYARPVVSSKGVRFRKNMVEVAERPPMARVLHAPTRTTWSGLI
jgi:hypothetical protein